MASKKAPITIVEFGPLIHLPEESYQLAVTLEIQGEPGRKSNQRRIVRGKNGKPMIIKSQKAMNYQDRFLAQVPNEAKLNIGSLVEPLALWAHIYYASNRPDVSTELIQDLMEKAGVVKNDRFFKQVFAFGAIDKENPRVELRVYRICMSAKL